MSADLQQCIMQAALFFLRYMKTVRPFLGHTFFKQIYTNLFKVSRGQLSTFQL